MHCKEQLKVAKYIWFHVNRREDSSSVNLKEYLTLVEVQVAFDSLASIDFCEVWLVTRIYTSIVTVNAETMKNIVIVKFCSIKFDCKPNHDNVVRLIIWAGFNLNDELVRLSFNSAERLIALARSPNTIVTCVSLVSHRLR